MPSSFPALLSNIANGFLDPAGIQLVFARLCPGKAMNDPDIVGMGTHVDELIAAHVDGFIKEVLDPNSAFYHLQQARGFVDSYLTYFDVRPIGPDVMKYICAFGDGLERYADLLGERRLVTSIVRLNTVRLLRAAAIMSNSTNSRPPQAMVNKVYKVRADVDRCREMMGEYGFYMLFKTWALA